MTELDDGKYLRRCVALAREALEAGDAPFGSVLVNADGAMLAEDHNRESSGDPTRHPEFALARWAAENLSVEGRARATVYTSGEHCPMCAAAHAMVGLGRIVYASSTGQLNRWLSEWGVPSTSPVRAMPIQDVAPHIAVAGPIDDFATEVRELQRRYHSA